MVEEFLKQYALLLASKPDKIEVKKEEADENFVEIIIYADKSDTRKLIGRGGRMINAIKRVLLGCKAKSPTSYRITVKPIEEM